MRLRFIFIFSLLIWGKSFSQDLKLIKIDNQSFPRIKLTIELNDKFDIHELTLIENGQKRLLTIDSLSLHHGSEAICYLIDINKFNLTERQVIYNALSNAVGKLESGTVINVCYIATNNQEAYFIPLSYEFTDQATNFIQFTKENSYQFSENAKNSDLDCALEKTINFVNEKEQLPNKKTIVILTKGYSNSSKVNQILESTRTEDISIKILSNVLDTLITKIEHFYSLQTWLDENELFEKLNKAGNKKDLTNININKSYLIEFVSTQNNFINELELHFNDQIIKTHFKKPNQEKFPRIIWFIVILLFLISFIIFLIFKHVSQKRKLLSLKETLSLLFDKKMKILSTQTQTPVIEIKLLDQVSNYHIKKRVTTLGRKKDCDVIINNLTISSHHASITNEGGEFYIQDYESTNGVFVNDLKISKTVIKNEDIIRLGKAILSIHY